MEKKLSITQITLDIWAAILIVWSIYRAKFSLSPSFDEFVAKPIVFLLPLYIYITQYEHKTFFKSFWIIKKNIFKELLLGAVVGMLILLTAVLSGYIKHANVPLLSSLSLVTIVMSFVTAISEETLSQGFVVKRLYEDSKNFFSSAFIGSLLFFILHIPILFTTAQLHGNQLVILMITDMLLGLVNSFIFLSRKNLILPIFIHAFYSIVLALYL